MEYVDISEDQITKRQHYVPRAYLKNFTYDEERIPHVYVVFPSRTDPQPVSIENICCRTYLYDQIAIDPDSGAHVFSAPNELERFFGVIEGRYAAIISKLKSDLQDKNNFELAADEISVLKEFMSLLVWRNPIFIHISNAVVDKLFAQDPEYIEHIQKEFPDVPPNVFISHLAHDFLKTQLLISSRALFNTMEDSQICIFQTTDSSFITSAMPVKNIYGERNSIKYDLMGMPITPTLFLAFIDAETILPKVVTLDGDSVKRINSRQLGGSKNILISNRKDLLSFVDFSFEIEDDPDDSWLYSRLSTDKETALKQYNEIMDSKEIKYWR